MICKRSRPVLVLHERKTHLTLMSRLAGKTAAETIAAMMATFAWLDPKMRGSITFDNDTCFARHMLLRGMLSATTFGMSLGPMARHASLCDAYASWQKGGVENANGRIRRWLPRGTDLDQLTEQDIQGEPLCATGPRTMARAMTLNLTPRKCLGYKSPVEVFPSEPGKDVEIRFARSVAPRGGSHPQSERALRLMAELRREHPTVTEFHHELVMQTQLQRDAKVTAICVEHGLSRSYSTVEECRAMARVVFAGARVLPKQAAAATTCPGEIMILQAPGIYPLGSENMLIDGTAEVDKAPDDACLVPPTEDAPTKPAVPKDDSRRKAASTETPAGASGPLPRPEKLRELE